MRFGEYGGMFVPEILVAPLLQLSEAFERERNDPSFQKELGQLLRDYAGRPTPLYRCRNLCAESGVGIYLKREDLLHGGAHKTNQVLAQGLLAKRLGKTRLIAETGAGQHGVATAVIGALLQMQTVIYMGAKDVERQAPNVNRMRLMGAEVVPVTCGASSLKDAINEALRDWAASFDSTHYLLGTVCGPHPYPLMVREFQRVIGKEAREQFHCATGSLPDAVIACVGGGSNAMGIFSDFVADEGVDLIGVEAAGEGLDTERHGGHDSSRTRWNFAWGAEPRASGRRWPDTRIALGLCGLGLSGSWAGARASGENKARAVRRCYGPAGSWRVSASESRRRHYSRARECTRTRACHRSCRRRDFVSEHTRQSVWPRRQGFGASRSVVA